MTHVGRFPIGRPAPVRTAEFGPFTSRQPRCARLLAPRVLASVPAASRDMGSTTCPPVTRPSMARPCLLSHAEAEHRHGT
jgi:hypothetical protein